MRTHITHIISTSTSVGLLETLIRVLEYASQRLYSEFQIRLYRLRGYSIGRGVRFEGRVFLFQGKKGHLSIGSYSIVRGGSEIMAFDDARIEIGSHVRISQRVTLHAAKSITIGNNCMIGPDCYIIDTDHPTHVGPDPMYSRPLINKPVIIGQNVWLGRGVTVVKGVTIDDGCVVGAGSVVTKNLESDVIFGGVPAKKIRSR